MAGRARFWTIMGLHTSLAAGTYLFGKAAADHLPVLVLGFLRFAIAGSIFIALAWGCGPELRKAFREDRGAFIRAGLFGVVLNQVAFLWGLQLTLPSHAALLYALTPTMVLLLGWARGLERPSLRKVAGLALAFAGVLVLFQGRHAALPPHWMLGDVLVLVAVLAWAGYTVTSRPLVMRHGARTATTLSVLAGSAFFLPLCFTGLAGFHPSQVPFWSWFGVLYLGLVTSVVMYLLWFHALGLREPSRVAIAANGQPILTALAAWIFLAQTVTPSFAFGAALVIAGVVVTQY